MSLGPSRRVVIDMMDLEDTEEPNIAESFSTNNFGYIGKFGDIGTFGDMGTELNVFV
jgi:hypothetical protein